MIWLAHTELVHELTRDDAEGSDDRLLRTSRALENAVMTIAEVINARRSAKTNSAKTPRSPNQRPAWMR